MKRILVSPIISEKATSQATVQNKYHFKVALGANKLEIERAIEARFDVKIQNVRTMNFRGKSKVQHTKTGRFSGKKADWKKAIVTLKDGFSLDLYSSSEG